MEKFLAFRCGVVSVLYDKCTFAVVGFFLAWQEKTRENSIVKNAARRNRIS